MNTNLQNLNWQRLEKEEGNSYREKVMELGRELLAEGEITIDQLQNSYFELFVKPNKG